MRIDIDMLVGEDPRAHKVTLTDERGGGIVFEGEGINLSCGVRPLAGAVLELAAQGKGPVASWARRARAALPGSG